MPLNPLDDSLFRSVGSGVLLGYVLLDIKMLIIDRKLINAVAPGTVDWTKMRTRNIAKFTQLENLNIVLDAAKRIGCNIVNLSAEDLVAGKVCYEIALLPVMGLYREGLVFSCAHAPFRSHILFLR